jgi:arginine decarboxylase
MTLHAAQRLGMRALVINDDLHNDDVNGRAIRLLTNKLSERGVNVVEALSAEDATAINASDSAIQCVILDWDIGKKNKSDHKEAMKVLEQIRFSNDKLPIFLQTERSKTSSIPLEAMQKANDFIWLMDDTPDFISGRIVAAMERYRNQALPPMFGALARFSRVYEYSWHTPGHAGGTAFLKHPAGRAFFEFFGEDLFRSDLSISVGQLGSLLDHTGPIGESERYAAQVFGSHRSYHITNGSSTSNRVILMSSVTRNDITLCDRNCHKSVEHAMTLSGALPVWLVPSRNHLGIIGPIYPEHLTKAAIAKSISKHPLITKDIDPTPIHAIITNSTYDGLCYNAKRVEELLGQSVNRLHFDEAWYGYARFNSLYKDRHAMHGDPKDHAADGPTVFATHSTHKLLAALSQASFIHVRDGRDPIEHHRFNESFMMHSSTSPQYAIIASNDVAAAMMDGPSGPALTTDSIREAVAFRQMLSRLKAEFALKREWFFNAWQPEKIKHKNGKAFAFHEVPEETLVNDPSCWVLHPDDAWHGFPNLEEDYCMLDPIKVSVVTPGVSLSGKLEKTGIPAAVVTAYLAYRGILVEKTTNFTILFLFSIGITQGKWGSLINAFLDFKHDYDANTPLERALPELAKTYPQRYRGMGLKDLSKQMFEAMRKFKSVDYMSQAFSTLPKVEMSPVETYERLVKGDIEAVTLDKATGRVAATGIVPYPPGIPLSMPGENMGPADGPLLGYLKSLEAFDSQFPGFGHDTHGVENIDGKYHIHCLKTQRVFQKILSK